VPPTSSWVPLNDEAVAAMERREYGEAVRMLERCIAGDPDEPVFERNLAFALAGLALQLYDSDRREDRAQAMELQLRAMELLREDLEQHEAMSARYDRWRRAAAAEEGFLDDGGEHFQVSYAGEREALRALVPGILSELEAIYQEYGESFGFFPVEYGRPRIRVILYTPSSFDAVTGLGHWAGGVFDGAVRVPVQDARAERERLTQVLRHELLHAFVQEAGGRGVPGWLNEGLAQWLEAPALRRPGLVARARQRMRGTTFFPLAELQGSLASWTDTREIERAYAQSLALVAWIHEQYGERVLYEMVGGCRAGKTCAETFRARIGVELTMVLDDLADLIGG
jgi:hypothetical protein